MSAEYSAAASDLKKRAMLVSGFCSSGSFHFGSPIQGILVLRAMPELGHRGAGYHLEFTRAAGHPAGRAPTRDNLLVFYLPDVAEWRGAVARLERAGYAPVVAFNPYWDRRGRTFEDPDGYRVVFQNAAWPR